MMAQDKEDRSRSQDEVRPSGYIRLKDVPEAEWVPRLICHFSLFSSGCSLFFSTLSGMVIGLRCGGWRGAMLGIGLGLVIGFCCGVTVFFLSHFFLPKSHPVWTPGYYLANVFLGGLVLMTPGAAVYITVFLLNLAIARLAWS